MHFRSRVVVLLALLIAVSIKSAHAAVPTVLHYQGVLTDIGGTPITTNTSVTFTLWSAPIAGSMKWQEVRNITPDTEGRFAILLGQAVPLHDSVFKFPPLYLGVQVAADPELTPRSLLASNAFAFRISTIDGATGGSVYGGTELQDDGSGDGFGVRDPGGNLSGLTSTSSFFENSGGQRIVEVGDIGILFVDPTTLDTILQFYPTSVSLEVGVDNSVTGFRCIAVGFNNSVSGFNSSAFGSDNGVTGQAATAVGTTNTVTAFNGAAFGSDNRVDSAATAYAVGSFNTARGLYSAAVGKQNYTSGNSSGVFGGALNRGAGVQSVVCGGGSNVSTGLNSFIGGGGFNQTLGEYTAVIAGNGNRAVGDNSACIGGQGNRSYGIESFVGAGRSCSTNADHAAIVGGERNEALSPYSFVGAGFRNRSTDSFTTIAGGELNNANDSWASVGGGYSNDAVARSSTIAGGFNNQVSAENSTVGGGTVNTVFGMGGVIAGGVGNFITGDFCTIPGGHENSAQGKYSFASGRRSNALNAGAFLWADSNDFTFQSVASNEFAARATGGVRFVSGIDGTGTPTAGVTLAPGGGSWSSISDRNAKENVEQVDVEEVLTKLSRLEIAKWNYTAQGDSIRHIGPMAQDFHAAFGVGEDDKHITTIDADGVMMAAIQALHVQNNQLRELLERQQLQIDKLMKQSDRLKTAR